MFTGYYAKVKGESIFRIGNTKLSKSVLILNMTSAKDCVAKNMGLCSVANICYARKPEIQYPDVLKFRNRQAKYWDDTHYAQIFSDICDIVKRRKYIKYFRLNESGDFRSAFDVAKLDKLAKALKTIGIKTYCYSARKDLKFGGVSFNVRLSGIAQASIKAQGMAVVIKTGAKAPKGAYICPGKGCGDICKFCMESKRSVGFAQH